MQQKPSKSILPKGLFARAGLILAVPILTTQLVVAVVFIESHFTGVTNQMVRAVTTQVDYFTTNLNQLESEDGIVAFIDTTMRPLGMDITRIDEHKNFGDDRKNLTDVSGGMVLRVLRLNIPTVSFIDLARSGTKVFMHLDTPQGRFEVVFDRERISASNPHQLIVWMLVVSVFMTWIAFLVLRNQVRPIKRLSDAAKAFGKGEILELNITGATEVRQAGHSFVEMRERITKQTEQRSLMLSGISHDLRTPLTRLKLNLSLLDPSDDIDAMSRDIWDMEMMLDEFLAFTRGAALEQAEPSDPVALVFQAVEAKAATGFDVSHITKPTDIRGIQRMMLRPVAIRRALDNLINNAAIHASKCEVSLTLHEGMLNITVEDDGPGIPKEKYEEALKPFVRLDEARNLNHRSGVGLGLSIARDIASSHGGNLSLAKSQHLGGLKVTLQLPL